MWGCTLSFRLPAGESVTSLFSLTQEQLSVIGSSIVSLLLEIISCGHEGASMSDVRLIPGDLISWQHSHGYTGILLSLVLAPITPCTLGRSDSYRLDSHGRVSVMKLKSSETLEWIV